MENKWIIEIVKDEPRNYYCKDSLQGRYIFNKYIEIDKSKIDIGNLHLYSYKNDKLELDSDKVRLENIKRLNARKQYCKKILNELKVKYSEIEFEFKNQYLQKNRANGDRDNLTAIVVMILATGQTTFNGWKILDKDSGKWVYINLTLDEMKQLAQLMQYHVTKAMKIETDLLEKLETMAEEDIDTFDFSKEYERLWKL